jgi:hypothetical protein
MGDSRGYWAAAVAALGAGAAIMQTLRPPPPPPGLAEAITAALAPLQKELVEAKQAIAALHVRAEAAEERAWIAEATAAALQKELIQAKVTIAAQAEQIQHLQLRAAAAEERAAAVEERARIAEERARNAEERARNAEGRAMLAIRETAAVKAQLEDLRASATHLAGRYAPALSAALDTGLPLHPHALAWLAERKALTAGGGMRYSAQAGGRQPFHGF